MQDAVANPSLIPQLQMGISLNMCLAMDMVDKMTGETMTQTYENCPLFMHYHLKGVYKSNCGRRNVHRCLYVCENDLLC